MHSKKKCNSFTKVFIDDVKSDVSKNNEFLAKTAEIAEDIGELNHQTLDDDEIDNSYHDDSNDSLALVNIDKETLKDETSQEQKANDIEARINDVDNKHEQPFLEIEKIYHDKDEIDSDIKITNLNEETKDLDKPNLDNKFQRSVKKKFLDENHWTKITLTDEEATRRFQAKALEQKYLRADFKCVDCFRTFSQEDMMKRHVKLRHCAVSTYLKIL